MSDVKSGFALVMAPDWSALLPGDQAWVDIYGNHRSDVEKDVKKGVIKDFALALRSPDVRSLSLAVYVYRDEPGISLDELADAYEVVLTQAVYGGYGPGEMVDRRELMLAAGRAVRLESTLPYTGPLEGTVDDHVVAYVLVDGGRSYYFVFRGNADIIERHFEEFACMAESLRFTSGGTT
jgi:hypothetical protein